MEAKAETVLILNSNGGVVFNGQARLCNFQRDDESGCPTADCRLEKNLTVMVWKIDDRWQGWLN